MGTEFSRIAMLRALFSGEHAHIQLGIGDDAAVLEGTGESTVWTIDAAVEGVHFRRDLLSMRDIGYRATAAAVSDVAAMGAMPVGILSGLILPVDLGDEELRELALGQKEAADALGAAVVGGNLSRGGELSITTAVMGTTPKALRRDGARPGDRLWLCGSIGMAAAGFLVLEAVKGERGKDLPKACERAILAFRRPAAHVRQGLLVREIATAAIDLSDGLSTDAGHLAKASGVLVVLEERALVSAELEEAAAWLGRDALGLALSGGEDYALLVAVPAAVEEMPPGFVCIGHCEALGEAAGRVVLRRRGGERVNVEASGFDHFRV